MLHLTLLCRSGKNCCTDHAIQRMDIEELVLADIREHVHLSEKITVQSLLYAI